jgi:hypothetical protein
MPSRISFSFLREQPRKVSGWVRRAGRFYGGGWIFFEGGFVVFYWGFWKKRVAKRGVFVVSLWWNVW